MPENTVMQKRSVYLNSETLLKFFLGTDDQIDTLIQCRGTEVDLITYDNDLYEALGSIKPYDNFQFQKLMKLFEVLDILSYRKNFGKEKPILTHQKVDELRARVLKKKEQ